MNADEHRRESERLLREVTQGWSTSDAGQHYPIGSEREWRIAAAHVHALLAALPDDPDSLLLNTPPADYTGGAADARADVLGALAGNLRWMAGSSNLAYMDERFLEGIKYAADVVERFARGADK